MKVLITEYLRIDLDREVWECRRCGKALFDARDNYKRGLLVYDRDPREIHKPLLDPALYQRTYSPDPAWCRILEYYCPQCGTMVEAEYLPPGHTRSETRWRRRFCRRRRWPRTGNHRTKPLCSRKRIAPLHC